mgnify:CR=1 FL=1
MRKRCEIITKADPVFTVSIHQNSYPEESVKGAQVFYYGQSEEGKELAETLQKSLVEQLDPQNHRQAKAYYIMRIKLICIIQIRKSRHWNTLCSESLPYASFFDSPRCTLRCLFTFLTMFFTAYIQIA